MKLAYPYPRPEGSSMETLWLYQREEAECLIIESYPLLP